MIRALGRGLLFCGIVVLGGFALSTVARAADCRDCAGSAYRPAALRMELPVFEAPAALPSLPGFASLSTAHGEIRVQAGVPSGLASALPTAFDADVRDIETSFARSFASRPAVLVFATADGFASSLHDAFGYDAPASAALAGDHGGVFDPTRAVILLNAERLGGMSALSVVRHELAHAMVHQLVGGARDLPAWLDEGIASSFELAGPSRTERIATASLMAVRGTRLTALRSSDAWLAQPLDGHEYTAAALAVEALEARVGHDALIASLAAAGEAGSVDTAFAGVAGISLRDFEAAFGQGGGPSIVIGPADGGLVQWWLQGFTPRTTVRIAIDGDGYHLAYEVDVDDTGTYWATFGTTAPAGEYRLEATAGDRIATATLQVE